jgi:hypothetical protein
MAWSPQRLESGLDTSCGARTGQNTSEYPVHLASIEREKPFQRAVIGQKSVHCGGFAMIQILMTTFRTYALTPL